MKIRDVAMPYALPSRDSIEARRWMRVDGSPLPDRLPEWDPATDMHIYREIEVEIDEVLRTCDLSNEARLELVPMVRSDLTGLRVVGASVPLDGHADGCTQATLSLHVRGEALGGTISVTTSLIWQADPANGPLAPRRAGSELWGDEFRCVLEGAAARFPVSAVDFSSISTLNPDAAWTLDWDASGLDEPILGAVRLLVNSENPRIRDSVISGSNGAGADVVRALVRFDVARTLITSALGDEEFLEAQDSYPEGSIGRAIADLLRNSWDEPAAVLAARMHDFPQRFEMELQARFVPVPELA